MTPSLIDTHCHLDDARFDADRDAVVERAATAGVTRLLIPATSVAGAPRRAAAGRAPPGTARRRGRPPAVVRGARLPCPEAIAQLRDLAQAQAVVAVGEIGLDFHRGPEPELQTRWLDAQLDLAAAAALPVILHNREATTELLARLRAWGERAALPRPAGVLHAFSAGRRAADWALAAGFYLGFGGMLTFRRADDLRRVASALPADRLVLETDAPYLAPEPLRGRRNEPAFVCHVAELLARLRGTGVAQIALQTTGNALRLFPRLRG